MLFVNGELRIIYTGADESIIKKVDEAFRQIGYRYDVSPQSSGVYPNQSQNVKITPNRS